MYRIAMLSVHTCPLAMLGGKNTGGMNVYVRQLSRELGRRGYKVDVFTRSENPAYPFVVQMGLKARVIHIKAGPEEHYDKNLIWHYLPQFVEQVKHFAAREGIVYDLLHSHYWLSGWVARELRGSWKTPIIQHFHTLGHMKNRVAQSSEQKETALRIEVETAIMRFADRLVAATEKEREQLIMLYGADPGRIIVIPCGVDLDFFSPIPKDEARKKLGIPDEHKMVLFVGRIEPLKGIDTLIQAIAQVVEECPNWRDHLCLAIIGGSAEDDPAKMTAEMYRLQKLREELGLTDLVTFMGARAQNTLPLYYSAAEVVVMPSHYESFGMVALEAMACGTPVIASDVGGLSFTVENGLTGYLVPDQDSSALADKIKLILNDRDLRRRLGIRGREAASRYSWSKVADQVITAYDDLLTGGDTADQLLAEVACCAPGGSADEPLAELACCAG